MGNFVSCKGLLKDFVGLKSFSIEKDLCIGIVRKLQFQKGMGKLACDLAQCEQKRQKNSFIADATNFSKHSN